MRVMNSQVNRTEPKAADLKDCELSGEGEKTVQEGLGLDEGEETRLRTIITNCVLIVLYTTFYIIDSCFEFRDNKTKLFYPFKVILQLCAISYQFLQARNYLVHLIHLELRRLL